MRWAECQRVLVTQEEESRRKAQEVDYEVNQNWTPNGYKKNVSYLDESEALKASTKELKEQVLSPNESNVSIVRSARQARSAKRKKLFQIFSRQGANEILVASCGEMGGAFENVDCAREGMPGSQRSD